MRRFFKKINNWEQWPFKILYAPISPVWLWYVIRSGSVWFFTPSNPKLTFGGMEGEPKKEMQALLPPNLYPKTINILPSEDFEIVKKKIGKNRFDYPFIVKPEVGGQGILFRKINTEEEFKSYHQKIFVEYIVQEMINYPTEVSVFYYRYPDQPKGFITGFLHKIPMYVTGDAKSTLAQLIVQHPKAYKRKDELFAQHKINLDNILADGDKYMLSYAANHNRGARFINLQNEIDERLVNIFDKISISINDFFYGRYDIMCTSVEDLKQEKNFSILEYNGSGAEPNHFYDTGYTLAGAYKEILKHWKILYEISKCNHKKGIKYWPFMRGLKFLTATKKYYRRIREADKLI